MDIHEWFEEFRESKDYTILQEKPLAYFSIEFALSDKIPTYAGGLGILAGDFIKELADQHIPAVAVGMYYQNRYGYDSDQGKNDTHPIYTTEDQDLELVTDDKNTPLIVKVPIQDRDVFVQVWKWQHNSIPLYLLDTNVTQNNPSDRAINHKLYDANKETRFKQEMILGIGGFRVLEALHIAPSIYHMNEGHSALLVLEVIRHEMEKRKLGFHDALALASHHVVFTNHTLVPAGNDIFSNELFSVTLNRYASSLEVPITEITELGNITDSHDFSMSVFAMRLAGKITGVSKLHAATAKKVWPNFTLEAVTNGIHIPSWENKNPHEANKQNVIEYINQHAEVNWHTEDLLLGWARRMVRYKRPLALFGQLEEFLSIATHKDRPVRVVMAGIAHQADDEGQEIIARLLELVKNELHGIVVYLPDYNQTLAKILVSGCDVWLNTPVVGSEACGTSGMKASLNGVLPLTTKDGWAAEVAVEKIGWSVESDTIQNSLLQTLKEQIVPTYYSSDKAIWKNLQQSGQHLIRHEFSATRMLKDYFEKAYLPILTTSYEHYT